MITLPITPIDPNAFEIVTNSADLRRDVHTFVAYVSARQIKRSNRTNELPPADYKKLAQLLRGSAKEINPNKDYDYYFDLDSREASSWVDYVDDVAYRMGFVRYDTKGSYRSYNSQAPSFSENYIQFDAARYRAFLALTIAQQECTLLDTLINSYNYSHNEFYLKGMLARLKRFPRIGSAVGVMPSLNFPHIRRFLLELLQNCTPGIWYSTESLIAYLKAQHRYFLIPEKLPADKYSRVPEKRYGNFYEAEDTYPRDAVPDNAPDGFERVEGRYVERFLENIPLTLGYVEVAYVPQEAKFPLSVLKAFRVTERLSHALRGDMSPPKITVQPNFEIHVESLFYPATAMVHLAPLTDVVREDTTTILRLQKQKVAAQMAENPDLHIIPLLQSLSSKPLPQNILAELDEWSVHADAFTLYDGFDLIEFAGDPPHVKHAAERIGETFRLVRKADDVFTQLREAGSIAIRIQHAD